MTSGLSTSGPSVGGSPTAELSDHVRRRSIATGLYVVWTVFVWGGRIRNALGDDELTASERMTSLVLAGVSIAIAVVVAALAVAAAIRPANRGLARAVMISLGVATPWTIGVWASRMAGMVGGDWSVGFILVHTVLAVLSVVLVVWALVASVRPLLTKPG